MRMTTNAAELLPVSGAELIELDAVAVRTSLELVERVTPADLARPTPCAAWTLYGLLAHMATQHHGFAAASAGDDGPAPWRLRPLGADPVATYREAAAEVLAAFRAEGVLDREFPLPELSARLRFPAAQAISFHFVDYVVHAWDVAATLGLPVRFEPEVLTPALAVARAVPGGERRLAPGAAFAPAVSWPAAGPLTEILALLGRSPAWPGSTPE
jgi:uncharacterized protein (TIGR03086 family)